MLPWPFVLSLLSPRSYRVIKDSFVPCLYQFTFAPALGPCLSPINVKQTQRNTTSFTRHRSLSICRWSHSTHLHLKVIKAPELQEKWLLSQHHRFSFYCRRSADAPNLLKICNIISGSLSTICHRIVNLTHSSVFPALQAAESLQWLHLVTTTQRCALTLHSILPSTFCHLICFFLFMASHSDRYLARYSPLQLQL